MMVKAMEQGIDTREGLQDYLNKIGRWEGETFSGQFGENQRFVRDKIFLHIVENGKFVAVD